MFELVNIFETFLPQLLLYPNPDDPLNAEAAALFSLDFEEYKKKVFSKTKEYSIKKIEVEVKTEEECCQKINDKCMNEENQNYENLFTVRENNKEINNNRCKRDNDDNSSNSLSNISDLSELSQTSGIDI